MTQIPPAQSGPSAFENQTVPVGGGVPDTSYGQEFLLEEQAGYAARGQTFDLSGTLIPPQYAGDFWAFYTMAQTFASNTGWRYLLTPQQLIQGLQLGYGSGNQQDAFAWMASVTGVDTNKMPWAPWGLSATQYEQNWGNATDALYQMTGSTDFVTAGMGGIMNMAMRDQWSAQRIQDYILQNPALSQRYGYLKYGYTYQSFQQYKTQNADSLKQRYGAQWSDAQAIENIGTPAAQFHASGGQFGAYQPYVKSDTTIPTGNQSGPR